MKKIIITLITVLALSMSAFAQGGTAGDITWKIEDSTLTISGKGAIPDYNAGMYSPIEFAPWYKYRSSIYRGVLEIGVTRIGHCAFYACYNLTSIIIPNSITSIGGWTFSYCTSLTSISIPNSVTTIREWAFYYCESLTLITNFNPVPVAINSDVFGGVNKSACTLEVPINSVSAYKEAPVWKEFNIVGVEVGVDELPMTNDELRVYPNPTTGKVYIETESEIKVYNQQGELLQETFGNQVDLSDYPKGVYLLQVNGRLRKVVKQ